MPCTGEPDYNSPHREINFLTAQLCWILENHKSKLGPLPPELAGWWEQHQIWDNKRKTDERKAQEKVEIMKKALSKLTAEEKKALKDLGL